MSVSNYMPFDCDLFVLWYILYLSSCGLFDYSVNQDSGLEVFKEVFSVNVHNYVSFTRSCPFYD